MDKLSASTDDYSKVSVDLKLRKGAVQDSMTSASGQRHDELLLRQDEKKKAQPKFRLIATLAQAVARWRSQINPTYTFGHKKPVEEGVPTPAMVRVMEARKTMSERPHQSGANKGGLSTLTGRITSARTASGQPKTGARHLGHGNKANILFGRMPEMQAEAARA